MKHTIIDTDEPRNLLGFKKKSFMMSVDGGEVWFEHLDGIYNNPELVLEKLTNDSKTFLRPSMPSLLAVVFDETDVDVDIVKKLADMLTGEKMFTRVAVVGVGRHEKQMIKKALCEKNHSFALAFINDFQKAKEWLVSEEYC